MWETEKDMQPFKIDTTFHLILFYSLKLHLIINLKGNYRESRIS